MQKSNLNVSGGILDSFWVDILTTDFYEFFWALFDFPRVRRLLLALFRSAPLHAGHRAHGRRLGLPTEVNGYDSMSSF